MSLSIEILITMLRTARLVTERYLADLSDQDIFESPAPGANPIAWQLGHMVISELAMLRAVEPEVTLELPEGFEHTHGKPDAQELVGNREGEGLRQQGGQFLPLAEYLTILRSLRSRTESIIESANDTSLKKPSEGDIRAYAPTQASVFVMIAAHEMMHSGQIAVLRRRLKKPIVL